MPNIKTFCRIKPTAETYEDHDVLNNRLCLRVPEQLKDISSTKPGSRATVSHDFNFDYIFKSDSSQEEVFDVAALEIVNAFLEGYNGTIFAYGQTGTGKTYTVEGSAHTYKSRGLEPRALSLIYRELEKRSDESLSIHLSYLEIYQEIGYDLLNTGARTQSYVTPFPKVSVLEGPGGMCIVRNLSNHLAASEDVAQSLLLQGQANRKVAATAIHDRSSRSHAVFTIQLTAKKLDSDTVVRSKLHLVDLAGSERVAKTRVMGQQLSEAKCINLSLHYLESVIVALQQESIQRERSGRTRTASSHRKYNVQARPSSADGNRTRHVPYRNSLLTMLLRDSLGGNCMTSMIATISLESNNLGESISTCRFALRVACIANTVSRNEELDEKSLIRKLRKRIAELEAELACLRLEQASEENGMHLTEEDKQICAEVVRQYLTGKVSDPISAGITNPYKFRECLKILKRLIKKNGTTTTSANVTLPQHEALENGDEPDDQAEAITRSDSFQRRSGQKLRETESSLDPSSRPSTTSAWTKPSSSQEQGSPSRRPPQGGSAWINRSSSSPEKGYVANSKKAPSEPKPSKEPETLSTALESDKYKSPFEQKRVEEIKKLGTRVERIAQERQEKEQEISTLKNQVVEKELDLMERHMRTKVSVTAAQVEDQKAYVKQLTSTEADQTLVEQEKLVERQLKKRLAKFEGQLEYIQYRRELLNKQDGSGQSDADKKASVEERFGQFRNRDGSLNTRQVFQMLKTEERKEHKAKTQVERQRIMTEANLMELKELATRQKLRELKEAMKSGSAYMPNGQANGHINGHVGEDNTFSAPVSVKLQRDTGESDRQESSAFVRVNGHVNSESTKAESRREDSSQLRNTGNVQTGDIYANRKQDKDPESKWASNYSRPTTPSNLRIPDTDKVSKGERGKGKHVVINDVIDSDKDKKDGLTEDTIEEQSRKIEEELYHSKNRKYREKNKNLYDSGDPQNLQTYMPSEYVYGMTNPEQFDARKMGLSSKNFDSALTSMLGKENTKVYPESSEYEQYARTSKYQPNPYLHLMRPSPPKTRSNSQRPQRNNSKSGAKDLDRYTEKDLQRPISEDSQRPVSKDSFRPISKDSQRPISKDSQRPFTRDSSRPVTKESQRSGSRDRHRGREPRSPDRKPRGGPEQENSPISAKIARYIQQPPSREKKSSKLEIKFATDGEAEGFDMTKFLRSNTVGSLLASGHTSGLEIEEEHGGKVTAMREQEREHNFMSKANVERDRVSRIRKARQSAEVIQRSWRRYLARKKLKKR